MKEGRENDFFLRDSDTMHTLLVDFKLIALHFDVD